MIDEPEIAPDDTDPLPPTSLDDRLRAEEPPIDAGDTSPSQAVRTHAILRAEEPPVSEEDTSPSRAARLLADEWPPRERARPPRVQRVLAPLMLLGAALLTALAAYVWMAGDSSDEPAGRPAPTASQSVAVAQAGAATHTPAPLTPTAATQSAPTAALPGFPTAAADEIAAALLTPAARQPADVAVQRESAPFTIRPGTARTQVIQYTVQDGDTLESIAAKFNLSDFYTLIWSNRRNKYSPLRPGVQLNILPEDGVYHEVTENITIADLAERYGVDPYVIIDSEYNDLFGSVPDTLLVKGMWVVVPGGEAERVNLLPPNPNAGPASASGGVISGTYTLWGCTSNISGGSPPYGRPLNNYVWMQGFTLGGHEGVDLAARVGEPVYAAGSGTVAFAGWSQYGYGNVVVIAHGATFSLYGHLDSYAVRCGQSVSAGSQIGTVGNTGNSSGPHLHFEVRDADWNAQNPRNYVGF